MTGYARSAYGSDPHAGANRNNQQARGWGSGWPHCHPEMMAVAKGGGISVRCQAALVPLVAVLLEATALHYTLKPTSCGAYNCRPIAGTSTPSNHSYGCAIDLNWNDNPMRNPFHCEIPPAVVHMWEACGFYWGGRYSKTPDTMHFEFLDRASDVKALVAKAKGYLSGVPDPTPVPDPAPGTGVTVSLANVLAAAKADPKAAQGVALHAADVAPVETALVAEGLLDAQYSDGSFGSKTVEAYKAWQVSLHYSGAGADGLPGKTSLTALGAKHGFGVGA